MSALKVCWVMLLILLWGAVPPASAETRYVIDVLVINLRDGPRSGAESIAHLRTGDGFEVLGTEGDYLQVRTPDGKEGWVPQQYTTAETPKARVIAALRQDLSRAKKQASEAQDELTRLQMDLKTAEESHGAATLAAGQELAAARKEAKESATQRRQVKKQYDDLLAKSKGVLEITAERDALRDRHDQLQEQVEKLDGELGAVTRSNLVTGLLVGGGLVLAGWLLGSTSRKKKSRYSVV